MQHTSKLKYQADQIRKEENIRRAVEEMKEHLQREKWLRYREKKSKKN